MKPLLVALMISGSPALGELSQDVARSATHLSQGLARTVNPKDLANIEWLSAVVEMRVREWERSISEAAACGSVAQLEALSVRSQLTELGLIELRPAFPPEMRAPVDSLITKVRQARLSAGLAKLEIEDSLPEPPIW